LSGGDLPSVFDVFEPTEHAINRNKNVLSVELSHVEREGTPESDPERFLALTVPTEGLVNTVVSALKRVAGLEGGEPVQYMTERYGGGKTHVLVTLYHLATSERARELLLERARGYVDGRRLEELEEVLSALEGKDVRVVVLDGDSVSEPRWWVELAERVDPELAEEWRSRDMTPSKGDVEELLDRALDGVDGVLLLLDEVTGMLIRSGEEMDRGLEFLKILARVVGKADAPVAMVVSAPKGSGEVQRQLERLKEEGEVESEAVLREEVHDVGEEAVKQLDRVGEERIPVSDVEEAAEIAKVWLLRPREDVDVEEARGAVVEAYEELTSELAGTEGIPRDEAANAVRRLRETYPFHPRLLEVLRSVTREEPYQLTRSYLEILMQVVGYAFDRWKEGEWEAPVFDLGDVFLDETEVEEAVVKPEGWEEPAGDLREKLDDLVEKEGELARRLAYALFVRSLVPDPRKRGATPKDLLLDVARPGEGMELSDVERALELMEDTLFYLHREGERYYFDRTMNVSSVIQSYMPREERVGWNRAREELERELRSIGGLGRDALVLWEDEEELLNKLREPKPRVVILPPWESEERAEELWEKAEMKNAPVFLVFQDKGRGRRLLNAALRLSAVERALRSDDKLARKHGKELRRKEEEYRNRVRKLLREGYTILRYPSEGGLARETFSVEEGRSLGSALGEKLEEIGFLERVKNPGMFVSEGLVEKRVEMVPKEVLKNAYSKPGCPWCREEDVIAMIVKGCEKGFFVVDTGKARFFLRRPKGVDSKARFGHPTVLYPPVGWTADFMGADETVKDFLDDVMKRLEEPRNTNWSEEERWLSDDELLELVREDLPQGLDRAELVLRHQDEGRIVGPGDLEKDKDLLEAVLEEPNAWVFEELKVTRLVSDEVRREGSIARRELVRRLSQRFGLEESRVNGAISRLVQDGELEEDGGIVSVPSEAEVTVDDVVSVVEKKGEATLDVLASRLGVNPAFVEPAVVEGVKRGRLVVYRGDRPLRDLESVSEGVRVGLPEERVEVEYAGDPVDFAREVADAVLIVGGRARVQLELESVKGLDYVDTEYLARFEEVRVRIEVEGGVLEGEKKEVSPRNDGWWIAVRLAAGQASGASLHLTGRFDRGSLTDLEEAVRELADILDPEEARATVERVDGPRA